jgi:hypothetical protein
MTSKRYRSKEAVSENSFIKVTLSLIVRIRVEMMLNN